MRWNFTAIIFLSLIIPQGIVAQLTTYKFGDTKLRSTIDKNLVKYHNEELILSGDNAMLLGIINISRNGKISSVSTLNPTESKFRKAFVDAVTKTKGNWLPGKDDYTIILLIYVINQNDSGHVTLKYKNIIPTQKSMFPVKAIILEPIIIEIQWMKK